MYNLPEKHRGFVNSLASSGRSRNAQMSMAVAKAIADKQNIPAAPVDDLDSYYTTMVKLPVSAIISSINEIVIIDTVNVERFARLFFKVRYRILHPVGYIMDTADGHGVKLNFLGIGGIITNDMMSCLKDDFTRVAAVYNGISELIAFLANTGKE